jgi:aspartate aminotransferase-like enzyme
VKTAGRRLDNYTLFTPGPIDIPEDILQATAQPLVYHREDKFQHLLAEITENIKKVLDSKATVFFFTASGTGGMEAALGNILTEGDTPIVAVCGKFGERWLELCNAYRIKPIVIREDYGRSIPTERIEKALKQKKEPTVVFTTLTETSTGALDDIKSFGTIARQYGAFLVVDGVAGIGADYCSQNDWHIDILVGASQKALMAPPGISFIAVSPRALEKIRKSNLANYYFNIPLYEKFVTRNQVPFTPAITILYGLRKGLEIILATGLEKNFRNHQETARYVRERVTRMGCELLPEVPSNALTVMRMDKGRDSTPIIKELKERHGILLANGQGELKGRIIRIGHMGNYPIDKMKRALDALEQVLGHQG